MKSQVFQPTEAMENLRRATSARAMNFLCMALAGGLLMASTQARPSHRPWFGLGAVLAVAGAHLSNDEKLRYGKRFEVLDRAVEDTYAHSARTYLKSSTETTEEIELIRPVGSGEALVLSDAIQRSLGDYDVPADWIAARTGPSFHRIVFKLRPPKRVSNVVNLAPDLQQACGLPDEPIIHPMPEGVAFDVGRSERQFMKLEKALQTNAKTSKLSVALGVDLNNQLLEIPIAEADYCHIMGGGATGGGKSMLLHSMILSLMLRHSPGKVQFVFIDPKRVEFSHYADCAHILPLHWSDESLRSSDGIIRDVKAAEAALNRLCTVMDDRYSLMEKVGVTSVDSYLVKTGRMMPHIVVVVDEFADLILRAESEDGDVKPNKKLESAVARLAGKARAAGIHLWLFTQRPEAKVLTPLIRSNMPVQICLKVRSDADSTIVLGDNNLGGERLLGRGDMLVRARGKVERLQGLFLPYDHDPDYIKVAINAAGIIAQNQPQSGIETEDSLANERSVLEQSFKLPSEEPVIEPQPNPPSAFAVQVHKKAIVIFAKTDQAVTARDASRKFHKVSADDIRAAFVELAVSNYGIVEGEGKDLRYTPDPDA